MQNGKNVFFHLNDRSLFLCLWLHLERFLFEPVEHSLLGRRRLGRSLLRLNELLRGLLGLLEVFLKTNKHGQHVTPQQSCGARYIRNILMGAEIPWNEQVILRNNFRNGAESVICYMTVAPNGTMTAPMNPSLVNTFNLCKRSGYSQTAEKL